MFGNRPSKKQIVENINRAGNNKLRDRNDYLDKKEHLLKLLSMPNVPVEDKEVIRDRLGQLEQAAKGLTEESEPSSVVQAITRRIILQRADLLKQYGPEKVIAAIDEVADFVGDVDEIGSSDVSGWIKHVEQMLGNMEQDVEESSFRDDEFRNRERNAGLEHETNNIQIAINGKPWKVVPGKGYADSPEERSYLQGMKRWAEKKSASSGKKWTVYLTGANVSEAANPAQQAAIAIAKKKEQGVAEETEFEPTYGKSPEDLGGADAYYHRGCNPGKFGFERGSIAWDSYLKGYKASDEGPAGGKQWESAATEDDIEKHMMEMRHAGYGLK